MYKSLAGRSTMSANRSARVVGRALLLVSLRCCRRELGAGEGGAVEGTGAGKREGVWGGSGTKPLNKLKSYQESPPFNLVNSEAAFFSLFLLPFFSPLLMTFRK